MLIEIRWPRGSFRITVDETDKLYLLREKISQKIQVKPENIIIKTPKNIQTTTSSSLKLTVASSGITDHSIIDVFVKEKLPDTPICKMGIPVNYQEQYYQSNEKDDFFLKKIQSLYGPRVVTTSLIEHFDNLKPQINYQEESSTYAIRVSEESLSRFRVLSGNFSVHMLIFLFGRINKISGKVTVHTSIAPQQINYADHVEIDPSYFQLEKIVLSIAKELGMECVGMAVSHPCKKNYPIPPYLARMMAKFQNLFGEYFTTLSCHPDENNSNVQVFEAFQVSDAAMKIDARGYFLDKDPSPTEVGLTEPLKVDSIKKSQFDVNWLLVSTRVRYTKSKIPLHSFPWPNSHPTLLDLKNHLDENNYCPLWYTLFDFSLLIFLESSLILNKDQMKILIRSILTMNEIIPSITDAINKAAREAF